MKDKRTLTRLIILTAIIAMLGSLIFIMSACSQSTVYGRKISVVSDTGERLGVFIRGEDGSFQLELDSKSNTYYIEYYYVELTVGNKTQEIVVTDENGNFLPSSITDEMIQVKSTFGIKQRKVVIKEKRYSRFNISDYENDYTLSVYDDKVIPTIEHEYQPYFDFQYFEYTLNGKVYRSNRLGVFQEKWFCAVKNVAVKAVYKPKSFELRLDYMNDKTQRVLGEVVYHDEVPTISVDDVGSLNGHNFAGWYSKAQGGVQVVDVEGNFVDNANILNSDDYDMKVDPNVVTLYARWSQNRYNVEFVYNDNGEDLNKVVEVGYNESIPYPDKVPRRPGMNFVAWQNPLTQEALDFDTFVMPAFENGSTFTVKPLWEDKITLVRYNPNGGDETVTGSMVSSIIVGESGSLSVNSFERRGYSFSGWCLSRDGDGVLYDNGGQYTLGYEEEVLLYAIWQLDTYRIEYRYMSTLGNEVELDDSSFALVREYTVYDGFFFDKVSKKHYSFDCWKIDGVQVGGIFGETGDKVVVGYLIPDSYDINYNLNGGVMPLGYVKTLTVESGENGVLTLSQPTKRGYEFLGWYIDPTLLSEIINGEVDVTEPKRLSVFAKWSAPIVYSIDYHYPDGINTNVVFVIDYTIETDAVALPELSKSYYDFIGWYEDSQYTKPIQAIKKGSSGNKELFALFTPTRYAINYEFNGGVLSDSVDYYTVEDEDFILGNATKRGYTFLGWYLDSDYQSSLTDSKIVTSLAEEIAVYAKWSATKYSVTYHGIEGADDVALPTEYTIEQETVLPSIMTRDGYVWRGFYRDEDTTDSIAVIEKGNVGDIDIYGLFLKIYKITYLLNEGVNAAENPKTYVSDEGAQLYAPTKEGYKFIGFMLSIDENVEIVQQIKKGTEGDLYLYADFRKLYPIYYYLDGGVNAAGNPDEYCDADEIELLDPSREGYTFDGWYYMYNKITVIKYIVGTAGRYDIYARWQANTYSLTYSYGDGRTTSYNLETDASVTIGSVEWQNKALVGWSLEDDGTADFKVGDAFVMPPGDTTLYAVWTATKNTVGISIPGGKISSSAGNYSPGLDFATLRSLGYTKIVINWTVRATKDAGWWNNLFVNSYLYVNVRLGDTTLTWPKRGLHTDTRNFSYSWTIDMADYGTSMYVELSSNLKMTISNVSFTIEAQK